MEGSLAVEPTGFDVRLFNYSAFGARPKGSLIVYDIWDVAAGFRTMVRCILRWNNLSFFRMLLGSPAFFASCASASDVVATVDGRSAPWDVSLNPKFVFNNAGSSAPRYVGLQLFRPGSMIRIYATNIISVSGVGPPSVKEQPPRRSAATLPRQDARRTADQLNQDEQSEADSALLKSGHAPLAGGGSPFGDPAIPPPQYAPPDLDAPRSINGSWGPLGEPSQIANGRAGPDGSRYPSFYIDEKHYPVRVNELIGVFVDRHGALVSKPFPVARWVSLRVPDGAYALALGLNSDAFGYLSGFFDVLITDHLPMVTVGPISDGDPNHNNDHK